ncbi:MAG: glucose-1-phosphate adenylyltransferase subunit GlgD [Lachnospiraceae bacterium]|jgi:glucose-1-phosphate adenylyltransferase|nr:glucose-1-phosphate adenylyltransferase subunit GlgD [Lachnospiraceae bacterium]MBQ8140014.1 glucose-1-phosphate adenylyltransferase subunit GlgD [Lachnospiraceae bacterium]MBR1650573.1 glucose-1-phosphate adenylyltransferase subunit GlgD [Lachnospiraceae bacterium]MBR6302775.1 glucose-1-phosphate adenylyltransferase subunit GlgD [Lachnospiraceae bacterium]
MRAIGIILAGGSNHRMDVLSQKRAVCAMPIAGSYRSIDFTLSNMSNSHIQKVAVLTQYNAGSLNEHLNSSKWWDFGRKQGGLYVLTPAVTAENSNWYRGTADAIYQNISFLKKSHEPYVVIANGDCVYKMDFNKVLEYHIDKKADITVVCSELPEGSAIERYGTITMNEDNRIEEFEEKPLQAKSTIVSCGVYVIRRRQLIEMIEKSAQEDRYDFVRDILIRYKDIKRIYGYKTTEYWRNIAAVDDYFNTNMDFLKKEVRDYFFRSHPDIYSKVDDLPPAKYNPGAAISNSLVSSGCIVNGVIEDSVIFKKSYIGNNTTIKNSIILNDVYIADNVTIENCIIESHSTIKAGSYYKGDNGVKIVVERNERYTI